MEKMSISNEIGFSEKTGDEISILKYGKEWPIVYMIYSEDEIYVGETVDAKIRMLQHYANPERRRLKNVRIISDDRFNKSVILDLESFLISHISADKRFPKMQNGNAGHQKHNYYQKEMYEAEFDDVWKKLCNIGLAKKSIKDIENSNLFKYSPYKSLTDDQFIVSNHIITNLAQNIENNKRSTYIVNGGPGTGKTVLAIFLMKLLATEIDKDTNLEDENLVETLARIHTMKPDFKMGIVVSMSNLRETLRDVFGSTYGLSKDMVYTPSQIANSKEEFDLLIVDEAHRLKAARNMMGTEIRNIRDNNKKLGINENEGTQLDWIIKKSKHQIFFYDEFQTIKRTDVGNTAFEKLKQAGAQQLDLETQVRCGKGGQKYINYIRQIFSDEPPKEFINFKDAKNQLDYEFLLFDDVREMTDLIIEKDKDSKIGLCRNIAGDSWVWKTKGKITPHNKQETDNCISHGLYDIDIDGNKYIWNTIYNNWVATPNSVNEIGCIHTIQGFDLNYAGVIIGNELKYNEEKDLLYISRESYFDENGKKKTSDEALRQYIFNIYAILCTRGINGTYIYACDEGLRKYLKRFIKTNK